MARTTAVTSPGTISEGEEKKNSQIPAAAKRQKVRTIRQLENMPVENLLKLIDGALDEYPGERK